MTPGEEGLLLLGAAFASMIAGGDAVVAAMVRRSDALRRLRRYRRTTVAEANDGERVWLVGEPLGDPVVAPASGRPCLHWSLVVSIEEAGVLPQVTTHRSSDEMPLHDGTGVASVIMEEAWFALARPRQIPASEAARPDEIRAALARAGWSEPRWPLRTRIVERTIVGGQRYAVGGLARVGHARGGVYRDGAPRITLTADGRGTLIVTDRPEALR